MRNDIPNEFDRPSRHRKSYDKLKIEDGEQSPRFKDKLRRFFKRGKKANRKKPPRIA
jgi:hypothetical protein